jgi:hypothetical protein
MTINPEDYMRNALDSFAKDPPDTDFQEGYLAALMVFANEAMGFAWNDPALAKCENLSTKAAVAIERKKRFDVIDGGAS